MKVSEMEQAPGLKAIGNHGDSYSYLIFKTLFMINDSQIKKDLVRYIDGYNIKKCRDN